MLDSPLQCPIATQPKHKEPLLSVTGFLDLSLYTCCMTSATSDMFRVAIVSQCHRVWCQSVTGYSWQSGNLNGNMLRSPSVATFKAWKVNSRTWRICDLGWRRCIFRSNHLHSQSLTSDSSPQFLPSWLHVSLWLSLIFLLYYHSEHLNPGNRKSTPAINPKAMGNLSRALATSHGFCSISDSWVSGIYDQHWYYSVACQDKKDIHLILSR
jgi:hypothetical protein